MQVKFIKRLEAYLIDFIILMIVTTSIGAALPKSDKLKEQNQNIIQLQEKFSNQAINSTEYVKQYSQILPQYDRENIYYNICSLIFVLGYFIVIPVVNNGQTIGKKIMKIRVIKNNGKLTLFDMLIRSMIVTSLLQILIETTIVYLLPNKYYNILSIVSFLNILLVIITVFMILYRKDKKGVQDLITNTSVIEVEK